MLLYIIIIYILYILYIKYVSKILIDSNRNNNIKYKLIEENDMGLVYKAFLPAVGASDVVKRTLSVKVDGIEKLVDLNISDTSFILDPVKDNSLVELSVRDTDDAGNVSDWSESLSFTAIDTIIPSAPGKISVKLVDEVADPAPAPSPSPVVEASAVVTPPPVVEADVVAPVTPAPVEAVLDHETPTEEALAPVQPATEGDAPEELR